MINIKNSSSDFRYLDEFFLYHPINILIFNQLKHATLHLNLQKVMSHKHAK